MSGCEIAWNHKNFSMKNHHFLGVKTVKNVFLTDFTSFHPLKNLEKIYVPKKGVFKLRPEVVKLRPGLTRPQYV